MPRHANNLDYNTTSHSFRWRGFIFLHLWKKSAISKLPHLHIFRRPGKTVNLRSLEDARPIDRGAAPELGILALTLHFCSRSVLYQSLTWLWQISPCLCDCWCWALFMEIRPMDSSSTLTLVKPSVWERTHLSEGYKTSLLCAGNNL